MFHLQKYTCCVAVVIFLEHLIRHERDTPLVLVILRRTTTKAGLMHELFGHTVAERSPHVRLALVKSHDARESLAAMHQRVGSTYF